MSFGGKPQRDWSLVMGTKRSISNASRKLAAVVKELAEEEEGGLVSVKASHGFDGAAAGQHQRLSFQARVLNLKLYVNGRGIRAKSR